MISIHAPLTGCDDTQFGEKRATVLISIHAPLTGCDAEYESWMPDMVISIHAPLTGCDKQNRPWRHGHR